jgi:hypothetical protein
MIALSASRPAATYRWPLMIAEPAPPTACGIGAFTDHEFATGSYSQFVGCAEVTWPVL